MAEPSFAATLAASRDQSAWRRSLWTLATSTLLQGGAITALIVAPLLVSYSLPAPISHLDMPTFVDVRVAPPPAAPGATRTTSNPGPGPTVPLIAEVLRQPTQFTDVILEEWSEPVVVRPHFNGDGVWGGVPAESRASFEPPPERDATREPVRIGGNVRAPVKTRDVAPVYPAIAIAAGVQGVVILEATIDARGNVQNVRALRSSPLLEAAAIEAVKQWKYAPTLLNGNPVPIIMTVTVSFNLQQNQR